MSDVWVVIAAFNEEKNIGGVIDKTKEFCKNIVVVDDGSRDDTFEIAKSKGVFVLRHVVNLGKGAAVKTGCDFAVSRGAGILVLIDGDGQHDPSDIPRFLDALNGKDVIFGFRKLSGSMPFVFRFGNWVINLFTRFLYGVCLRDTQCGFRVLTADAYKKVRWRACDYFMESEMIANVGRHKLKYCELPISTVYADKYKGTTVVDGFRIVLNLFLWRFRR